VLQARGILKYPLFVRLVIPLSRDGAPLSQQVYKALREAILSGKFSNGEKLPSTRDLAEQLGVSRTVVLLAYDQLLAEGFASGRAGSGTYVSSAVTRASSGPVSSPKFPLSRYGSSAAFAWSRINFPPRRESSVLYDFAYGRSDVEDFPFEMWRRILLRCARKAPVAELDYGWAAGNPALRDAISVHLRRSRAVVCDASQVIVVNGSQQAIDLIARVLIERGDQIVIEDPSYQGTREALLAVGARLHPVGVDDEGLDPHHLPSKARIAFVTPSHQFPTGAVLPLGRRIGLLEWARRNNALLVEDDYDGEFRYEGQPLESLQGLDREGRVIYVGTFSRTVFSSLRIGYLIAPRSLVTAFSAAKWLSDRHTATLEQETLAEFIGSGMYERYLRRVRRRNAARRTALLDSIQAHLGNRVEVTGDGAGAHVVLWPKRHVTEHSVIADAASRGVGVYGISPYFMKQRCRPGLLLGYSRMREAEIREGIRRLANVM
jgi:GntR family transcriptional regulator/MocR family aminotransferase